MLQSGNQTGYEKNLESALARYFNKRVWQGIRLIR